MLDLERKARNQSRLMEMHPAFRVRVEAVLRELERAHYLPRIELAWRSPLEQLNAYRQGRSRVTFGFHNITATNGNKEALAADIWNDVDFAHQQTHFMLHLLAAAEANGLTTGLRWDLTPPQIEKIDDAIKIKNWHAIIFAGWEPLHVEVTGLTIQEAKEGKRPPLPGHALAETDSERNSAEAGISLELHQPKPYSGAGFYAVENTDTGHKAEYETSTALRPVTLLPVPYADLKHDDPGAVAAILFLRACLKDFSLTPAEFHAEFSDPGEPYLSVPQLRDALASLGVPTDFKAPLSIPDLFNALAAGKPLIIPLRYKVFAQAASLTGKIFEGPYCAVAVGMDIKNIYLHDPLGADPARNDAHPYPLDLFWKAWKAVASDPKFPGPERGAIIPLAGIGFKLPRQVG